jgi:DNA-directed RNA polymerase subunit RPC12/RpoP
MNTSGKGKNMGQGSGRGSGQGSGRGSGRGSGQGGGRGRNKGGAFGPGGFCVCTRCGEKIPHQQGVKCTTLKCPECGHTMIREELLKSRD